MNDTNLKQIPLASLFAALGIVVPQLFHLVGLGASFLPMFLPVIIGSMFLSWRFAITLGIVTPTVSWLLTSMPPIVPPILPVMVIELMTVSLIISVLKYHLNKSVWIALITAIVFDRLLLFLIVTFISPLLNISHPFFTAAVLLTGVPGILLQIITVPAAVKLIEKKLPTLTILS